MFGVATLYDTEIRRVDAARRRVRRLAEAVARRREVEAARSAAITSAKAAPVRRSLPWRVVRALLPGPIRSRLRSMVRPTPLPRPTPAPVPGSPSALTDLAPDAAMDLAAFLEFTVDDLFYADHDLDRAMDLLAICRVPASSG
jgi:hypothetical protein